jgi:hypothetical protein
MFYHLNVLPRLERFARGMEECLRPMAYEVRNKSGPTTSVLTPDIGMMGYISGVKVYDTAGRVDPETMDLFFGLTYDEGMEQKAYLRVVQPDFVLDRSQRPGRLESAELKPVMQGRFPSPGLMHEEDVFYTLYRRGSL